MGSPSAIIACPVRKCHHMSGSVVWVIASAMMVMNTQVSNSRLGDIASPGSCSFEMYVCIGHSTSLGKDGGRAVKYIHTTTVD